MAGAGGVTAFGWACTALGLTLMVLAVWWLGFLSGRRYESGIWERWLDRAEAEQAETTKRRGVRLKTMKIRR